MTAALFNLLLPLSIFGALGIIIYAIILLTISFRKKSRRHRILALQISIIPVFWIVGWFSFFAWTKKRFEEKLLPQVPGTYLYSCSDSTRCLVMLHGDNSYVYDNGQITGSGHWSIDQSCQISFFDLNNKLRAQSLWQHTDTKKTLLLKEGDKIVEFVKQK